MESHSNDKIGEISGKLIKLLKENHESHWSVVLQNIRSEYVTAESKNIVAKQFIIIMRGGMGSFLDLVLHKDRQPLIDANDQLDKLRHQLYEECKKITSI